MEKKKILLPTTKNLDFAKFFNSPISPPFLKTSKTAQKVKVGAATAAAAAAVLIVVVIVVIESVVVWSCRQENLLPQQQKPSRARTRYASVFFPSVDVFSGEREHDTGKIETETDKVI